MKKLKFTCIDLAQILSFLGIGEKKSTHVKPQ